MSKHLYQILEFTPDNKIIELKKFGNPDDALIALNYLENEQAKDICSGEKTQYSHYLVVVRW